MFRLALVHHHAFVYNYSNKGKTVNMNIHFLVRCHSYMTLLKKKGIKAIDKVLLRKINNENIKF